MTQPLIFDAHLDLSMNALEWNRDLRWTVPEIRESEQGMTDRPDRGRGTVSFDAMRRGRVGVCVATLIARYVKRGSAIPGWHSQEQAWAQTQGQLAWYRAMEEAGELAHIGHAAALEHHLDTGARRKPGSRTSTRRSGTSSASKAPTRSSRCGISSGRTHWDCALSGPRTTDRACTRRARTPGRGG